MVRPMKAVRALPWWSSVNCRRRDRHCMMAGSGRCNPRRAPASPGLQGVAGCHCQGPSLPDGGEWTVQRSKGTCLARSAGCSWLPLPSRSTTYGSRRTRNCWTTVWGGQKSVANCPLSTQIFTNTCMSHGFSGRGSVPAINQSLRISSAGHRELGYFPETEQKLARTNPRRRGGPKTPYSSYHSLGNCAN